MKFLQGKILSYYVCPEFYYYAFPFKPSTLKTLNSPLTSSFKSLTLGYGFKNRYQRSVNH